LALYVKTIGIRPTPSLGFALSSIYRLKKSSLI
jgi:hypothetical protein